MSELSRLMDMSSRSKCDIWRLRLPSKTIQRVCDQTQEPTRALKSGHARLTRQPKIGFAKQFRRYHNIILLKIWFVIFWALKFLQCSILMRLVVSSSDPSFQEKIFETSQRCFSRKIICFFFELTNSSMFCIIIKTLEPGCWFIRFIFQRRKC